MSCRVPVSSGPKSFRHRQFYARLSAAAQDPRGHFPERNFAAPRRVDRDTPTTCDWCDEQAAPARRRASVGGVISDLVLGTMMFGTTVDRATSFAILDRYLEAGGDLLDTANCYAFWADGGTGEGQSERLLGERLRSPPAVCATR